MNKDNFSAALCAHDSGTPSATKIDIKCDCNKWISVKDRLPGVCERVFTIEKGGYMSVCQYIPRLKEFYECNNIRAVTHWMPLPLLPK